jgi:hypothetical protein
MEVSGQFHACTALFPRKQPPAGTLLNMRLGESQGRSGRPAHSPSLYRLSYLDSFFLSIIMFYLFIYDFSNEEQVSNSQFLIRILYFNPFLLRMKHLI